MRTITGPKNNFFTEKNKVSSYFFVYIQYCYTHVEQLLYNSIQKKVQHFNCWTGTVRLERLKSTGDVTFRENVILIRRGITKQLLTVSRATDQPLPETPVNICIMF